MTPDLMLLMLLQPRYMLRLSDVVAGSLLTSIWEGVVLVAAVALMLRVLPELAPAIRARLWLAVLLVLVLLPVLPLALPRVARGAVGHPVHLGAAWSLWLAGAWAMLSLARGVKLAASGLRLRRIAQAATPVEPSARIAALLGYGKGRVALCLSAEAGRPSVIGFFHPQILLPPDLYRLASPAELEHVVLHEMEHLRRRDDWTNLLQKLAIVALPLSPALVWAERRLCLERELACDDGVLKATVARKAYAACLVSLAEHAMLRRGTALALGAWERQSELTHRVRRILSRPQTAMTPALARFTLAVLLCGVLAGAGVLASSPQLVSFLPTPSAVQGTLAMDVSVTIPGRAHMVPAVAVARPGSAPHLTLASAAMPARPKLTQLSPRSSSRHGVPALRRAARPSRRQWSQPWVLLTSWRGAERLPVLTLAEADDFSPTYAAVPIRGGWLIVQL